jgi:hypothetical protein
MYLLISTSLRIQLIGVSFDSERRRLSFGTLAAEERAVDFHSLYVVCLQLPGLIVEPFLFVLIAYWLTGLRNTLYAFVMTAMITTLTMNVSAACGKRIFPLLESVSRSSDPLEITSWEN